MAKLSIIAPSLNHEKYIGEFIKSVLSQTFTDFELIIVDDCSTDKNVEIIKSFNDNRIKLIQNDYNMGINSSLNKGISFATSNFIAFVGTDDYLHKDYVAKTIELINNGADVIYHSYIAIDENNNVLENKCFSSINDNKFHVLYKLFFNNCLSSPGIVFKKEIYEKYCNLPAGYFLVSDYHLHIQLLLYSENILFEETPYIYYRILENSASHSNIADYRINIEFDLIYNTYSSINDIELFKNIFKYSPLYDSLQIKDERLIPFYLSFISIHSNNYALSVRGYKKLLEFYSDKNNQQLLHDTYGYVFKDILDLINIPHKLLKEIFYKKKISKLRLQRKSLIFTILLLLILNIIFIFWC